MVPNGSVEVRCMPGFYGTRSDYRETSMSIFVLEIDSLVLKELLRGSAYNGTRAGVNVLSKQLWNISSWQPGYQALIIFDVPRASPGLLGVNS